MPYTREQALAFVQCCNKGPMGVHLQGALGFGAVATPKDFEATNDEALERCSDLTGYLHEVAFTLQALSQQQEKKAAKAEEVEAANTIPGVPPAKPARRRRGS